MAGFSTGAPVLWDIAMVAHPSVTLLVDLSERECLVCDARDRRERGSVAVGLLPGELRVAGRGVGECLQLRLDPAAGRRESSPRQKCAVRRQDCLNLGIARHEL